MQEHKFSAIVLAAGQGKRMKSSLPKVLHPVAGQPMISRIVNCVKMAGATEVRVVVGVGESLVRQVVEPLGAICFKQNEQRGTADAVHAAQPGSLNETVLIINGDHPLIEVDDVRRALEDFFNSRGGITLGVAKLKRPGSLGRVIREGGEVRAIVEARDASAETLKIREVNTGIYVLEATLLNQMLPLIHGSTRAAENAQGEYYLTDLIMLAVENKIPISGVRLPAHVAMGVNSQSELAQASRRLFFRNAKRLMDEGAVFIDPRATYVEDNVRIGAASVIYPGAYIRGSTRIGSFCVVEPNAYLNAVEMEDSVHVLGGSYLENCVLRTKSVVGPYARVRPETEIGAGAHIGNFVELKKVKFGAGAKAGHLTYLGDAEVGENTNIGCGTITCNYAVDRKKYRTTIGRDVFVGSDTQFVAPVTVGDGAVVGSGSTITKDVPAKALAVARGKQVNIENYQTKKSQTSK